MLSQFSLSLLSQTHVKLLSTVSFCFSCSEAFSNISCHYTTWKCMCGLSQECRTVELSEVSLFLLKHILHCACTAVFVPWSRHTLLFLGISCNWLIVNRGYLLFLSFDCNSSFKVLVKLSGLSKLTDIFFFSGIFFTVTGPNAGSLYSENIVGIEYKLCSLF